MLHRVLVHSDGPALWPSHKPLKEVLELKETNPESVWEATYQGNPSPPGGFIFRRAWFNVNRYLPGKKVDRNRAIARWISWDTAQKEKQIHDYTAYTVGTLMPDYRLRIEEVGRDRVAFPDLTDLIEITSTRWNADGKLKNIILEDKVSGTSAAQTLRRQAPPEIRSRISTFVPRVDKVSRANQASVWARNGSVLLPFPTDASPWLFNFEEELFQFPQAPHDDMVDSFVQLVLFLENILSYGYQARQQHGN